MACQGESIKAVAMKMHDDILLEVLSWLPAKSLMQFKSVSKHWLSLITHPLFIEMHQTHSYAREDGVALVNFPGGLDDEQNRLDFRSLWVISLKETKADTNNAGRLSIQDLSRLFPDQVKMKTNIVNGLICFYDEYVSYDDEYTSNDVSMIFVYNLTTREVLPLPPTGRGGISFIDEHIQRSCFLCFDPKTKEYKVLCVWEDDYNTCEVFTVGNKDNGWKPINISSNGRGLIDLLKGQHDTKQKAFCHNGFLYWTSWDEMSRTRAIMVFDVEHEKFEFIKYPTAQELDHPRQVFLAHIGGHLSLLYIGPCLPASTHRKIKTVTLWKLIDGRDKEKPVWKKHDTTCQLPGWTASRVWCNCSGEVFMVHVQEQKQFEYIDCYNLQDREYRYRWLPIDISQGRSIYHQNEFTPLLVGENIMSLKNMGKQKLAI